MRVIELFAGIGACSKALKRIGLDVEIVDAVEIDSYAIKSFNAIHGTNFEVQDIKEWNKDFKNIDLITHGSPCQDFSLAGKQAGGDVNSGTRSSLMYETIRIVGKIRPKYVLWENVKNLLSKNHKHNFDAYINTMETLGYTSYYQVLNAKDYGIPQNRERVYTISIRKDIEKDYNFNKGTENKNKINRLYGLYNQATRWGVYDKEGLAPTITASMGMGGGHVPMLEETGYRFPEKENLEIKLKDLLEDEVEEKYYLSDKQIEKIKNSNFMQEKKRIQEKEYCDTLLARDFKDPKCVRIGQINKIEIPQIVKIRKYPVDTGKLVEILRNHKNYTNKEIALILDKPLTLVEHWFRTDNCFSIPEPDIWFRLKTLLKIKTNEFDKSITTFEEKEGVYEKGNRFYFDNGISPTITSASANEKIISGLRIRKLTPKECWRLMGFDDSDFEKTKSIGMSDTQLYKQAGNSIVVNVLEKIFENLF